MKDYQHLPSDWTTETAPGVFSITKDNAAHSDAGNFTLIVSTFFSNPMYKTSTATTTLDVLGKSRYCFYIP